MALTLLRHAPLALKYQYRYNGWSDIDIDISLFDRARVKDLENIDFTRVYSSNLLRCTKTLELIGFDRYIEDIRLKEVRFKSYIEGKSFEEISQLPQYSEDFLKSKESWHNFVCDESLEDFNRRIEEFLKELPRDEEILICSHAGVIKRVVEIFNKEVSKIDYLDFIRIDSGLY